MGGKGLKKVIYKNNFKNMGGKDHTTSGNMAL